MASTKQLNLTRLAVRLNRPEQRPANRERRQLAQKDVQGMLKAPDHALVTIPAAWRFCLCNALC
jgi:hypothetical protein